MTVAQPVGGSEVLTGRHVFLMVAGFFAVVFAVNGYFLSVALTSHTGVVAVEPYRKGLKYNERIAAAERQDNMGWRDQVSLAADGQHLTITMADRDGRDLRGLSLTAQFGRPATAQEDRTLTLTEAAPGRYQVKVDAHGSGAYEVSFEARYAGQPESDVVYRGRKRLWLNR